jgi:hypothetical protein
MFYGKDTVEENFDVLLRKLEQQELFMFEPMPSWKEEKEGSKWTDEFRIRDGHTKLADGTWVTIHKVTDWVEKLKKDTVELCERNTKQSYVISLLTRQMREMEFGLRSAQKSLNKALAMKGDSNE